MMPTAGQGSRRGAIQRLLARLYERFGARIVFVLVLAAWAVTAVTGLLMVFVAERYLALDGREQLGFYVLAESVAILGPGIVTMTARDAMRAILAWSGPARTAENAPAAWTAVATYPAVLWRRALPVAVSLVVASMAVIAALIEPPAWAVLPMALTMVTAVGGTFVVIIFGVELALRPMLEDIAVHLPPAFEPAARGWSVHAKALLPLPIVTMVAAVLVGAFADIGGSGEERLAVTYGIAVVIVAFATAIFFIITRSVLDPIHELAAATERVRAGDLTTTVPVVTADDLGELTASFNRMLEQLRESHARIVAASDSARRKVERDLHDGAQQSLVLLNLKLGLVRQAVAEDEEASALVDDAREELVRALAELRDLAHGIYPAVLENEGLPAALADAVKRSGIPAEVQCDGAGRYPRDLEAAVYFCCLEALQNASKHAGEGARATVRLAARGGELRFEVADDGRGFDAQHAPASAGLQSMADRIGAIGGVLEVASAPGTGTQVTGRVPTS